MADGDQRSLRLGRRRVLKLAASAVMTGTLALSAKAVGAAELVDMLGAHYLSFLNVHTSERLAVPFATEGTVAPTVLPAVRQLLHDHHDGSLHDIDPKLLDALFAIMRMVGGANVIHVVSGYRSPHTNSMLRMTYDGVAADSFHMRGQAVDFWVPGVPLADLHRAAVSIRAGGVGYYPAHQFIHVDVGPVRHWGGGAAGGGRGLGGPFGGEILTVNGKVMRLTPVQARTLSMHRRAVLWDRRRLKLLGK